MKFGSVLNGTVYATRGRSVYVDPGTGFQPLRPLPIPKSLSFDMRITLGLPLVGSAARHLMGDIPISNIWALTEDDLIATWGKWVYSSHDAGDSWTIRTELPRSSSPMGILPTALCEHEEVVYLGEYPLSGKEVPRILRSDDYGKHWQTHINLPSVRHVHAIKSDPYTGDIWITTGDRNQECQIGRLLEDRLNVVGGGSQLWRAVEPVFTPTSIIWGVDSGYKETNEIVRLSRDDINSGSQPLQTIFELNDSVFYSATGDLCGAQWIFMSTAIETSADSTVFEGAIQGSGHTRVIASSSNSNFSNWFEVVTYPKQICWADRIPASLPIPKANAYIFLGDTQDNTIILNPFNTATGNGRIYSIPIENFSPMIDNPVP